MNGFRKSVLKGVRKCNPREMKLKDWVSFCHLSNQFISLVAASPSPWCHGCLLPHAPAPTCKLERGHRVMTCRTGFIFPVSGLNISRIFWSAPASTKQIFYFRVKTKRYIMVPSLKMSWIIFSRDSWSELKVHYTMSRGLIKISKYDSIRPIYRDQ